MDIVMLGSDVRRARESVVLPAPEGEDMMRRSPRRAMLTRESCLFNVLDLLAELIDDRLELEPDCGEVAVGRLRAKRIRFAIEFLGEKIELPADGLGGLEKLPRGFDMGEQA